MSRQREPIKEARSMNNHREDDLIERVAQSIHEAEAEPHSEETGYGDIWGWDDLMPPVRERHLLAARAAVVFFAAEREALTAKIAGLEGALESIAYLAKNRVDDGDELGESIWRLSLTDIEAEARAALSPKDGLAE